MLNLSHIHKGNATVTPGIQLGCYEGERKKVSVGGAAPELPPQFKKKKKKVKAVLGGGPQRALCLGSAKGEILSAAMVALLHRPPPILPLGQITTAGQGGQGATPLPRPTAPLTIVAVGSFRSHAEDETERN